MTKEQIKIKQKAVKKQPEMIFTVDESLNKYKGPEFESPKLKEIREEFKKPIVIKGKPASTESDE